MNEWMNRNYLMTHYKLIHGLEGRKQAKQKLLVIDNLVFIETGSIYIIIFAFKLWNEKIEFKNRLGYIWT